MNTCSNKWIPNVNWSVARYCQIDIVHKKDAHDRFFVHIVSPLGTDCGRSIPLTSKRPNLDSFVSAPRKKRIFIVQNIYRLDTCIVSLEILSKQLGLIYV